MNWGLYFKMLWNDIFTRPVIVAFLLTSVVWPFVDDYLSPSYYFFSFLVWGYVLIVHLDFFKEINAPTLPDSETLPIKNFSQTAKEEFPTNRLIQDTHLPTKQP